MQQINQNMLLYRVWLDMIMMALTHCVDNIYQLVGFVLRPEIRAEMLICSKFQVVQETVDNFKTLTVCIN